MRILLTGHTGFVGQRVLQRLEGEICTLTENHFEAFMEALGAIAGRTFDIILHIGAVANPQERSTRLWQMNVAATHELLGTLSRPTNQVLFMSSYSVYKPDNDYGYSKIAGEAIVEKRFPCYNRCILRPVSIWGGDQSQKETPSIIHKFQNRELDYLFDNWYRDFVHIDDVVDFIVSQAHTETFQSGTFDLGAGVAFPCSELAVYHDYFGVSAEDVPPIKSHSRESRRVADPDMFPPNWEPSRLLYNEMRGSR